jgi:thermopsin
MSSRRTTRSTRGFWALPVVVLMISMGSIGVLASPVGVASASPSATAAPAHDVASSPRGPLAAQSPFASSVIQRFEQSGGRAGLPAGESLEPNFAYSTVREGRALVPTNLASGQVSPGPTSIGVNDLGLRVNSTGSFVPYWYRTSSLAGSVTINNLSLLPVMTNASDAITVQENAVLNNVTFFGQSIYQIWAQNVIFYSIPNHQLQLLTDGWNFTGGPAQLQQNDIYENSPGGFLFTGVYVHQVPVTPPLYNVLPPFTIRLYLNATNIDGRNALFFNYTLYSAHEITLNSTNYGTAINGGSFDWIIFNSTAGQPAGYTAPPASFLISGNQSTGIGLANDAEIALCGPSDGFSADFRSLNAQAQLLFLNGSTGEYAAVPAAFTTTEDTGESVEGVDVHFSAASAMQGAAYLTAGPEFVYGLWNASTLGTTERKYTVDVTPASTQLWVSPNFGGPDAGFFNDSAAWALSASPDITFWLPTGAGETYSAAALANDYAPAYSTISPGPADHISLIKDRAMGVYVPIIAFGNLGVASISQGGDGSPWNPYVISYSQTQPITSLYGTYDEFTEPLYPGLLFSGVSAHVVIANLPSLEIRYSASDLFFLEVFYGLSVPSLNHLPIEIYDSSNISVVHSHDISGWFPVTLTGFLYGSLFLSDDHNILVADNHFSSDGSSMVIVSTNGGQTRQDNTVFGNAFEVNSLVYGPDGGSLYVVRAFNTSYTGGPAVGGLGVFSSGNTIYNNLFETPITAYSPPQNPYLAYVFVNDLGYHDFTQVAATYHNTWNVPLSSVWDVRFVNGFSLFGSIVGAPFQGGNVWANWSGAIPYTDNGLIVGGGDHLPVPLPGSGHYAVVFTEIGLPSGSSWSVTLGGATHSSTTSMVLAYMATGTYAYTIPNSDGLVALPGHGSLVVKGNAGALVFFLP